MNNSVLCHWLLPKVITSTQNENADLINGWMNKVNLLKAHCTLCLGVQITHISTRATHTAPRGCLPDTHTHTHTHKCYFTQGSAGVLFIEKGMGPAGSISNYTVLMWLVGSADCTRHVHISRMKKKNGEGISILLNLPCQIRDACLHSSLLQFTSINT